MRVRGKLLAGGAAVAVMAACLISGPVLAGGDIGYGYKNPVPAPAGRTIWEGFHVGGHLGWADHDYGIGQSAPVASPQRTEKNVEFIGHQVVARAWTC